MLILEESSDIYGANKDCPINYCTCIYNKKSNLTIYNIVGTLTPQQLRDFVGHNLLVSINL